MRAHDHNPSTQKAESEILQIKKEPILHSKFQDMQRGPVSKRKRVGGEIMYVLMMMWER